MDPVFEKYLKILCYTSGMEPEDILGKSRKRPVCVWRFILWYYMHRQQGFSYHKLGRHVCRDHATVVYGVQCVEDFLRLRCYRQEKLHYMEFLINVSLNKDKDGEQLLCEENSLKDQEGTAQGTY